MSILTSKIKLFKEYISSPVPKSYNEPRLQYEDGVRGDLLSYASAPTSSEYKTKLDTNNYLPPPPRNQLAADPVNYMARKEPYNKIYNKYFLSTQNGISGIVQGQINNANYVRGNQFSMTEAIKRLDYTVEFPVQETPSKDIVITNSPFYPYPNYELTLDNKYKTYAHPKRYIDGLPIIEQFGNEINNKNIYIGITIVLFISLIIYNRK